MGLGLILRSELYAKFCPRLVVGQHYPLGASRQAIVFVQDNGVKPPFYVPLSDRVSGIGGRMFRA